MSRELGEVSSMPTAVEKHAFIRPPNRQVNENICEKSYAALCLESWVYLSPIGISFRNQLTAIPVRILFTTFRKLVPFVPHSMLNRVICAGDDSFTILFIPPR